MQVQSFQQAVYIYLIILQWKKRKITNLLDKEFPGPLILSVLHTLACFLQPANSVAYYDITLMLTTTHTPFLQKMLIVLDPAFPLIIICLICALVMCQEDKSTLKEIGGIFTNSVSTSPTVLNHILLVYCHCQEENFLMIFNHIWSPVPIII